MILYQVGQRLAGIISSWCRWPEPLEPRQRAGSMTGQTAGFGSALAPASYPAGPVTVSALELLCWLGNRSSFLTEIEILLPDKWKCQGSCLGPSVRLSVSRKRKNTVLWLGRWGVNEPVRLQITGYADVWVSRQGDRNSKAKGIQEKERAFLQRTKMASSPKSSQCFGTDGLSRLGHHHPCPQWWRRGRQHMASWDIHSNPFPMPQPLLAFPLPGELSLVFPRAGSSSVLWSQLMCHFSGEACPDPSLAPVSSPCLLPSWQSLHSVSGKFIYVVDLTVVSLAHLTWSPLRLEILSES